MKANRTKHTPLAALVAATVLLLGCVLATGCSDTVRPSQPADAKAGGLTRPSAYPLWQYDPDDPHQARVDHASMVRTFVYDAAFAYYREFRKMPESLGDLQASGWMWFDPLPSQHFPALEFVDYPVSPIEEHLGLVEVMFYGSGFDYAVVMPPRDNPEGSYALSEWRNPELADMWQKYLSQFTDEQITDSNPTNIRLSMLQRLCTSCTTNHWRRHRALPTTVNELLDGRWQPREDIIADLPVIPAEQFGWFYYGTSVKDGIAYIEYCQTDSVPVDIQLVYRTDDAERKSPGQIYRYAGPSQKISRDDTVPIVDASIPGWGFMEAK
jgi:hypothetical protein